MSEIRIGHWTRLGSAVRDARTRRQWTQHELAHQAGVSRSWLAKLEAGHRGAELEPILRLLAALDLSLTVRTEDALGPEASAASRSGRRGRPSTPPEHGVARRAAARALMAAHEAAATERRTSWDGAQGEPVVTTQRRRGPTGSPTGVR